MIDRLCEAFSSFWGWIIATMAILFETVVGHGTAIFLVLLLCVIDMILGIRVSHRRHRFTLSDLGRQTICKLETYGITVLVFIGIDTLLPDMMAITTDVVCTCIVLIEFWSASANMLILHPGTPLLSLLQKRLTGEIARKLDIPEDEVASALASARQKRQSSEPSNDNNNNVQA